MTLSTLDLKAINAMLLLMQRNIEQLRLEIEEIKKALQSTTTTP